MEPNASDKVPGSLRLWFVVHFAVDLVFALPLLLIPEWLMPLLGWSCVDPITSRLVGAALMGIGGASLLERKASAEDLPCDAQPEDHLGRKRCRRHRARAAARRPTGGLGTPGNLCSVPGPVGTLSPANAVRWNQRMESVRSRHQLIQINGLLRRLQTLPLRSTRAFVLSVATTLLHTYGYRGTGSIAYELISYHSPAFMSLDVTKVEALGQGIDSWHSVDGFARLISGPAWLEGLISDDVIHRWARSDDLWWRRAALVSTVALNMRSHGGYGDVDRTLAVCRMLVDDHEDMVVKALSWALRHLVVHDPAAVRSFLNRYEELLAARIKREVRNKLETGLKNPRRSTQ